jgi:hypothetical protein
MQDLIKNLWAGELPLGDTFWRYAIGYGLLVNLVTTVLFFALLVADAGPVVLMAAFALPIPYNLLVVVAVWRSADRYPGPRKWADLARVGALCWMFVLTAT